MNTNEQPACPPIRPVITIQFRDDEDLKSFERYERAAKAQSGTVTGLYAGLLCSAIKHAEIIEPAAKIEVLGGCAEVTKCTPGLKITIQDHDN